MRKTLEDQEMPKIERYNRGAFKLGQWELKVDKEGNFTLTDLAMQETIEGASVKDAQDMRRLLHCYIILKKREKEGN